MQFRCSFSDGKGLRDAGTAAPRGWYARHTSGRDVALIDTEERNQDCASLPPLYIYTDSISLRSS